MKIILFFSIILNLNAAKAFEPDMTFKTKCQSDNFTSLSFVGDILIHKALYQNVVAKSKQFSQIWKKSIPLLTRTDFTAGNLEGPAALGIDRNGKDRGDVGFIYDDMVYSGTNFVFNYHPRILSDLKNSGFDLITLANNHSTDRFSVGIDRTIIAAESLALPTVGVRKLKDNDDDEQFYKIVTIKNLRVAFLGCTEYINIPDHDKQVLFCEDKKIFDIIRSVSSRADVDALILMPHWGVEYSPAPQNYQKEYARRYLEAGALAVIGSHPHVLQPWEKYVTKNGRETVIMYSLGNFVAGQESLEKKTGVVAYLGLTKNKTHKALLSGVGYTPTYKMDLEIIPIAKNGNAEVISHVTRIFGKNKLLDPNDKIYEALCR